MGREDRKSRHRHRPPSRGGMIGQFLAAIPGERFVELTRQPLRPLDECRDDAFGIFVRDLDQHHVGNEARPAWRHSCFIHRSGHPPSVPVWRGPLPTQAFHGSNTYLDLAQTIALEAGVPGPADSRVWRADAQAVPCSERREPGYTGSDRSSHVRPGFAAPPKTNA